MGAALILDKKSVTHRQMVGLANCRYTAIFKASGEKTVDIIYEEIRTGPYDDEEGGYAVIRYGSGLVETVSENEAKVVCQYTRRVEGKRSWGEIKDPVEEKINVFETYPIDIQERKLSLVVEQRFVPLNLA